MTFLGVSAGFCNSPETKLSMEKLLFLKFPQLDKIKFKSTFSAHYPCKNPQKILISVRLLITPLVSSNF